MIPWALRGLRNGVVTTGYPRRHDGYADEFLGAVLPRGDEHRLPEDLLVHACPTRAISAGPEGLSVDRGRCILCLRCTRQRPDLLEVERGSARARLERSALVADGRDESEAATMSLRRELAERVSALGRSVHLRHIDCGSDGSDEWEVQALWNPVYDVSRLGIHLTASPRHADVLLVTGCGSRGMREALATTRAAMPDPVVVMAVGTDAISGGLLATSYASSGGLDDGPDHGADHWPDHWPDHGADHGADHGSGGGLRADVLVPGSPASPFAILHGLLLVLGRLPEQRGRVVTS